MLAYTPSVGHAGPKEDYEEAYKLYIAAGASVAAYHGRIGQLARRYLAQDGWTHCFSLKSSGTSLLFSIYNRKYVQDVEFLPVMFIGTYRQFGTIMS